MAKAKKARSSQKAVDIASAAGYKGPPALADDFLLGLVNKRGEKTTGRIGVNRTSNLLSRAGEAYTPEMADELMGMLGNRKMADLNARADRYNPGLLNDILPAVTTAGMLAAVAPAAAAAGAAEGGAAGGGAVGGATGGAATSGNAISAADAALLDAAGMGAGGNLGIGGATAGAGAAGAGGLFGTINDALGTNLNAGNVLSGVIQGGLGYIGAGQQADAIQDVANQNLALGAPYRDLLQQSYGPNFDLWSQPGYADALGRAADISTRAWSARAGNPAGNPTAQAGIYRDVLNEAFLPAMSNYRGQLGQFGGLGLGTAGAAQLTGAQQAGSGLDALAFGAGTALSQQPDWAKILQGMGGGNRSNSNPFSINIGGLKWGS